MGLCVTGLGFASPALAGPQHWGFGFGYLVTVEQNERGQRALSVYEPPLRVKDGAWLLRWRDTSEQYKDVIPGAVAVGNFWPQPMGKEHVVALRSGEKGVELMVLDAPESFSRRPWHLLGRSDYSTSKDERDTLRGLTAGDLLGQGDLVWGAPTCLNLPAGRPVRAAALRHREQLTQRLPLYWHAQA